MRTKKITPYLFIIPAVILLLLYKVYPILHTVVGSFFQSGAGGVTQFVGIQNYTGLFHNKVFYIALVNTLVFNLFTNPIQIVLAFISALVFNRNVKGLRFLRTAYYIPFCLSLVIATILWSVLLNPSQGLVNSILMALSFPPQPFLTGKSQAMSCIILIATWKGVAYWMMFFLAGLQGIPDNLYEACSIDGANYFVTLFKLTIPLMKPVFSFVIISDLISNMLLFAPMYVQTKGGPQMSTTVLMYEAFKSAYSGLDHGKSYAIVTILLILIIFAVSLVKLLMRDGKDDE